MIDSSKTIVVDTTVLLVIAVGIAAMTVVMTEGANAMTATSIDMMTEETDAMTATSIDMTTEETDAMTTGLGDNTERGCLGAPFCLSANML